MNGSIIIHIFYFSVSSNILSGPNASKEWEIHLEIEKLLEKISKIESGIT